MTYTSCLLYPRKTNESYRKTGEYKEVERNTKRRKKNETSKLSLQVPAPLMALLIIISFNQIEMTF